MNMMMRVLGCRVFSPFSLYVFEWIMDGKFSFGYRRTFNRTAISIRISCLFPPTIFSLSYCLTELFLVLVLLHAKQRNPARPQSTMAVSIYSTVLCSWMSVRSCRFWQMCVHAPGTVIILLCLSLSSIRSRRLSSFVILIQRTLPCLVY